MSVANMVPAVWIARLENEWRRRNVWMPLVSDRSARLSASGDRAYIGSITSNVTIRDYTGAAITVESAALSRVQLLLDKDKYWAVAVDDVDQVQAEPDLIDEYMMNAAEGMQMQVNDDLRGAWDSSFPAGNETNIGAYADTAAHRLLWIGAFSDLAAKADDANWPMEGRFAVIGSDGQREINEHFGLDSDTAGTGVIADAIIRDWSMGRLFGWNIVVDNGIPTTGNKTGRAGYFGVRGQSLAYAQNLDEVEAMRRETVFEDLVRGRMHYGAVRIRDDRCLKIVRHA